MLKRALFFMLLFWGVAGAAMAQSKDQESDLKAVFIYNFTKYIEWENGGSENRFIIGILGQSPLESSIGEIAKTNLAKNKKIVLKQFNRPEDISYCNILFIPHGSPVPLQSVLEKVDKGVLIISEEPGLARQGTAINFVLSNDKLKFEINLKALYSAGLKASSQLLKLATIVD
jgi:YfiR/HmsC-like